MGCAASKVFDLCLGSVFQHMFGTLGTPLLERLGFILGVEEEVRKLKLAFPRIQALLNDAEMEHMEDESGRLRLRELKDAAYDAEDILDQVEYEFTWRRNLTDEVCDLSSRSCFNVNMGPQIKKTREILEEVGSRSINPYLRVSERIIPGKRLPTGSSVDESIVFGREADKEKVVSLLKSDDSSASDSGIQVVPICGMGGLGKTTLAQLIFKDVKKHFDVSAWVYVSEDFDLIRLTKAIAESVSGSPPLLTSLNGIQDSIKEALEGKKFLLVLDDVWNENYNDWVALRVPLIVGARGSRILITTRSEIVSLNTGTVPTHFPRILSDDDCWSLFKRIAFVQGNSDAHPNLVKIGKNIVNKCNGLPLAVTTLGGLLHSVVNVVEWDAILKSEIWELRRNDILPALRLSYHHLPAHLKRCFEFCSVFPKGSYFLRGEELVWSWMALGFIQFEGSKDMEDIGNEYLTDLVSRSLLYKGEIAYRMHDLIHDLTRSVLGADILEGKDGKSHKNAEKVRHIFCDQFSWFSVESFNFENLYCFKSLRTLILHGSAFDSILSNIPPDLFVNLRHIRVLNLSENRITELPESMGNLIQLRYLVLSWTRIERLPKSITRLYNLQTLDLTYCFKLVEVPSDFSNLVNLRKILSEGCSASIPFGGLKSLQKLEHFKVGREIGYMVNELRDMNCLRGSLRILELENVISVEEAIEAELKNKQKIDHLQLEWESHDVDSRQEGIEKEVLNALQPHTNLERLKIKGYCGVRFPTWLGDSSFSKLVSISLDTCKCRVLPPFGQLPSLEHLSLGDLYGLEKVGREVYGDGMVKGFPSLKKLEFSSMPDLEEWTALEGDIIHVREIHLCNCSMLRVLPDLFPLTLEGLNIEKCEKLVTIPSVSSIRWLSLSSCDEQILRSLQHLTSLSSLHMSQFPTLTSLPKGLLQPLTSLEKMSIYACDIHSLPEELPTTLQHLNISYCSNLNCLPTGLKNLTSLVELKLCYCPKIHSLPEELPTTLQHLNISRCSNLICLPTGLKNLTSLVELALVSCPKIHFMPEELPTTLDTLNIYDCPLVTEKCKEGGEYWSKISHIPKIMIDDLVPAYEGEVMR